MAKNTAEVVEFDNLFPLPEGEFSGTTRGARGDGFARVISDTDHTHATGETEMEVIDIETAASEVEKLVTDAIDFITSELLTEWEEAEEFFRGKSNIPKIEGRSQVTETVVRDAIRALKPSIMRVFAQAAKIVEYTPMNTSDTMSGAVADIQSLYANQLFWTSGGYKALLDSVHDTLLKKNGLLKTYFCEYSEIEYIEISDLLAEEYEVLINTPGVTVISSEVDTAIDGVTDTYAVELAYARKAGELKIEYVPLHEFFIDDGATSFTQFKVCGQQRNMTIGDAMMLGIDFDDLDALDGEDVEMKEGAGESIARRRYAKRGDDDGDTADPIMRRVLITEAYARFDLIGMSVPQLYRFYLGGTSHTLLRHDRVSEVPYSTICADPIPGTFFGNSIYDVLMEDQDTQTSLLRATCDNAHFSNNKRLAVHDSLVNMDDVLNNAVGYPIRVKQPGMIQEIGVQSSVGAMLPLLQHLGVTSNVKVGITDAAMGLDPDALQSTDKDAVRNTINLSQGQVELMARNIAETGLKDVFDKLLRLSMRHMSKEQVIELNSSYLPIDQSIFNPSMKLRTCVGLGTASQDMKLAGLQQVMQHQMMVITQFGWGNPIVPVAKLYNTIADMAAMMGLSNVGRYFTPISEEQAQQMQQKLQQAAQKPDPTAAIVKAEEIRGQTGLKKAEIEAQTELTLAQQQHAREIMKIMMNDDLSRDEMLQKLEIEAAKLGDNRVKTAAIIAKQRATQPGVPSSTTGGASQ